VDIPAAPRWLFIVVRKRDDDEDDDDEVEDDEEDEDDDDEAPTTAPLDLQAIPVTMLFSPKTSEIIPLMIL